jgi:hypothetical protein
MSTSVFPVEIMNEIFRSSDLDHETLGRCCLLSHRFLESARRWLYHHVEIRMSLVDVNTRRAQGWTPQYSRSTLALLTTLSQQEALSSLVKSFKLREHLSPSICCWPASGVYSTGGTAIASLCSLAPMLDDLHLYSTLDPSFESALIYLDDRRLHRCRKIRVASWSSNVARLFSRHKTLHTLHINSSPSGVVNPLVARSLQVFRLGEYNDEFDLQSFLASSASSIRDLQIPLANLLKIDLSSFTQLRRLEVLLPERNTMDANVFKETGGSFWKRKIANNCSNLSTLAFHTSDKDNELDDYIFGWRGGLERYVPPMVRRIEFLEEVSLDRLSTFIDKGAIQELGVISNTVSESTLRIISLICKEAQVELIHLPRRL